jgi:hypothetical protein
VGVVTGRRGEAENGQGYMWRGGGGGPVRTGQVKQLGALVHLHPEPRLQSLLGLPQDLALPEQVQVGEHTQHLQATEGWAQSRQQTSNGAWWTAAPPATALPLHTLGNPCTCMTFINSNVSISKPVWPLMSMSTRSATLARSCIRTQPGVRPIINQTHHSAATHQQPGVAPPLRNRQPHYRQGGRRGGGKGSRTGREEEEGGKGIQSTS